MIGLFKRVLTTNVQTKNYCTRWFFDIWFKFDNTITNAHCNTTPTHYQQCDHTLLNTGNLRKTATDNEITQNNWLIAWPWHWQYFSKNVEQIQCMKDQDSIKESYYLFFQAMTSWRWFKHIIPSSLSPKVTSTSLW